MADADDNEAPPAFSSGDIGVDQHLIQQLPSFVDVYEPGKGEAEDSIHHHDDNQNQPQPQQQQQNVLYVDQHGNPIPAPNAAASQAPASNILYVDQNGNPISNPHQQQPSILYVDQNGNPIPAPIQNQQPNVLYVDQDGNPIDPPSPKQQQNQQQQPAIRYVDQNGNPVAPPIAPQPQQQQQPAIRYVDQNGNPIAAPIAQQQQQQQQQPAIRYVDQNGNPVAPPIAQQHVQQPVIRYVDQNGNPIAPPTNIRYVDQYGNPVAPPSNSVYNGKASSPVSVASNQSNSSAAKASPVQSLPPRRVSAIFAIIALIVFVIGLFNDDIVSVSFTVSLFGTNVGVDFECGWTEVYYRAYGATSQESSRSYSDLCSEQKLEGETAYDACSTRTAAAFSLTFMVLATAMCLVGMFVVQQWHEIKPCFCVRNKTWNCPRICFLVSLLFELLSIVSFYAGDKFCSEAANTLSVSMSGGSSPGGSVICGIIAAVALLVSAMQAKVEIELLHA